MGTRKCRMIAMRFIWFPFLILRAHAAARMWARPSPGRAAFSYRSGSSRGRTPRAARRPRGCGWHAPVRPRAPRAQRPACHPLPLDYRAAHGCRCALGSPRWGWRRGCASPLDDRPRKWRRQGSWGGPRPLLRAPHRLPRRARWSLWPSLICLGRRVDGAEPPRPPAARCACSCGRCACDRPACSCWRRASPRHRLRDRQLPACPPRFRWRRPSPFQRPARSAVTAERGACGSAACLLLLLEPSCSSCKSPCLDCVFTRAFFSACCDPLRPMVLDVEQEDLRPRGHGAYPAAARSTG